MQAVKLLLPLRRALSGILSLFFSVPSQACNILAETEEAVETVETVATWLQFATRGKNATKTQKLVVKSAGDCIACRGCFACPCPLCRPPFDASAYPPWTPKSNNNANRKNFKSTPTLRLFFGDYKRRTAPEVQEKVQGVAG